MTNNYIRFKFYTINVVFESITLEVLELLLQYLLYHSSQNSDTLN